ncbi:MAG: 2-amino-4-hydroxy-6-hydroxymethyldihydropteridine diphosphokinase [Chloroflexota bacterium]
MSQHDVFLLLGSNINKKENITAAITLLCRYTSVQAVSPIYESAPVGTRNQPAFYNGVVHIQTELKPDQIKLNIIQPIEQRLKRVRTADKNGPRTIDIDILLFNQAVMTYAQGRKRLPDEDILKYAHVAVPLAELIPQVYHPQTKQTFEEIAGQHPKDGLQKLHPNTLTGIEIGCDPTLISSKTNLSQ